MRGPVLVRRESLTTLFTVLCTPLCCDIGGPSKAATAARGAAR